MKDAVKHLAYEYESREKRRLTKCNLCGHEVFVTICHKDRYGYNASADACARCSLTVLNPVMTAREYTRFYVDVYRPLISAFHGRLYDAQTIQGMQREYGAERAEFHAPYMKALNGRRMLDIGGSTGVVAARFRQDFGLEPTVIDPAPLEIAEAEKLGLKTITGFAEDLDPSGHRYDYIALFQTVDHLLDVSSTLARSHEMLTEDGLFFVDIVDFRAAYLRNASVEAAVKIDHPYYLTESTMELYLQKHGFRVIAVDYAADHLHVGYLCRKGTPGGQPTADPAASREYFREIRRVQNAR